MPTVLLLLYGGAFVVALVSATGRAPLWPAVILLTIAGLLTVLPQ